jgi:hypothetical protein
MLIAGSCFALLFIGVLLYRNPTPPSVPTIPATPNFTPLPEVPEVPEIPESSQASHGNDDVSRYQCYAAAFWQGSSGFAVLPSGQCAFLDTSSSIPSTSQTKSFHTLPIEYPLLTIAFFTFGFNTSSDMYHFLFAIEMACVAGIIYFVIQKYGSTRSAIAFAIYLILGNWATAVARFDLAPAAFTIGAIILAGKRRWTSAFSLLALATLLKFYPVLLALPFLIAQQTELKDRWLSWRRWNAFGIFLGICTIITLMSFAINFNGTLSPIHYFIDRPFEVESVPASLLWAMHFVGSSIDYVVSFQSFNLVSPLSTQVSQGFRPLGAFAHLE